jgi:hypothetical protein
MAYSSRDSKAAEANVMMESDKWEVERVDATSPEVENYFVGKSPMHIPSTTSILTPEAEPYWTKYIPGGYSKSRCLKLSGKPMIMAILTLSGTCLMFFGYDAAVMSLVNINPDYLQTVGSAGGTNADAARVGGIVSFWFLGFLIGKRENQLCTTVLTITGAIMAGQYADKIGRLKSIQIGCAWGIFGAILLTTAQSFSWMSCARIINGIGCGHLNSMAPIWTSEIADYDMRGVYVAVQFTLCVAGACG